MKGTVIFLAALLVSGDLFSQDTIVWSAGTKLGWEDFVGKADAASPFVAVSVSGIQYKLRFGGNGMSDSVFVVFYRTESWVKTRTAGELVHEQGHFDITEVYARKMRKRLQDFVPRQGSLELQLGMLYDEVERERDAEENRYDRETKHGGDAGRQAVWNKKILDDLDELEEFGQ